VLILLALSFLITVPVSADSTPHIATRTLPWSCEESRYKAQEYFRERKIDLDSRISKTDLKDLIGESECVNCFGLYFVANSRYSPRPLDFHGKPLGGTFSVLRRYTARPRLQPRIYSDLDAYGIMVLRDAGDGGCSASLVFRFMALKWPFVPIMDPSESEVFESNGRLEGEYLDAISKISK
jgi:hypothetical protein